MSKHVIDHHVGAKIRELRNLTGVTQSGLAKKLGMSFQQVQKYEIGANRVSASKLYEIAQFFAVPIGSFFPDVEGESKPSSISPDEAALVRAYRDAGPQLRSAIRSLTQSISNEQNSSRSDRQGAELE